MPFSSQIYAFVLLAITWLIAHSRLIPKPIPGIPYNTLSRYMLWGELIALGIYNFRTGEVFSWLSLQCLIHNSALVQLFIPPFSTTHPILVLADLAEIEDIVTRRTTEIDRADMMHTWFGLVAPRATIGLKSADVKFREQRRLWNVVLSPKFLEEVAATRFFEAASRLCELWELKAESAGEGYAFEAQEDLRLATLDAVFKMCTGSELGSLDVKRRSLQNQSVTIKRKQDWVVFGKCAMPAFYNALERILICLDWVMQGVTPRGYTWLFRWTGILSRAEKVKDTILDECITSTRMKIAHKTEGILCALTEVIQKDVRLRSSTNVVNDIASDAALRDELLELLITGHETTASSIAWAIKYLTDHPYAQVQLRKSLCDTFSSPYECSIQSAQNILRVDLPYLDAVIAETLRISNTGPVSFRQTLVPCEIMGHRVPSGTPIILVTAGPTYNAPGIPATNTSPTPSLCQDAPIPLLFLQSPIQDSAMFRPERWLLAGTFDPHAVKMLPFSAGSRGCFGKRIALLEMRILLVVLILKFDFPRLGAHLSKYNAWDGLTRRPTCCFTSPKVLRSCAT